MVAINNTEAMKQWLSKECPSANIPEGTLKYGFLSTVLTDREMEIISLKFLGLTLQSIGEIHKLSKQRVSEILKASAKKCCHPAKLRQLFS